MASSEKRVGKFGRGILDKESSGPSAGHVSIARALSGLIGAATGMPVGVAEEQVDEFDMSGWEDDRPKKYNPRLVDKDTGEEIKLPAKLKDFRGDEHIVVSFQAPHKPSSTGRVYTKDGGSFFPSVVNAKIVDHEWDDPDNLDEEVEQIDEISADLARRAADKAYTKADVASKKTYPAQSDAEKKANIQGRKFDRYANKKQDAMDELEEDLDANQKRVGQLGPTEKVKNNNIGKLVGNESVDPYGEGSWVGDADRVYHIEGEAGLAEFLKMSEEELDAEINDMAQETGLHPDDDREELIFKVVQMLDDNKDDKYAIYEDPLKDILRLVHGDR